MTDRHRPDTRPEIPTAPTPTDPIHLVIVMGDQRLDVTAGSPDVVLTTVRLFFDAITGGGAVLEEIARATEQIDDTTQRLTDAQVDKS